MTDGSDTPLAVQQFTVHGGFAFGVIGADLHVFGSGVPVYLLSNWRPPPAAEPGWLRELPSRMLNARFAVVDFVGRDDEVAQLHHWRQSQPHRAVRWLYAPGGSGKTRLADRFAAQARAAGWKVLVATHGPGTVVPPPGSQDLRLAGSAGLLLLVDYADRWAPDHLACLLSNSLLHDSPVPVRILMVARGTDGWRELRGALGNEQFFTSSQSLEPVTVEARRVELFAVARNRFAALYELPEPERIKVPALLSEPGMDSVLDIHMAALVAVDAHQSGRRPSPDRSGLTGYLLDREHWNWVNRYGHPGHELTGGRRRDYLTPASEMHQVVFAAGLAGPVSTAFGRRLVDALCPDLSVDTASALADHAACYPPAAGTVLEPLYPDRLTEDFLALTIPGHDADYPARSWATRMVSRLTDLGTDADEVRAATRAVTFLVAAAERWKHLPGACLNAVLERRPDLAVRAGPSTVRVVAALGEVTIDVLEAVDQVLPARRQLGYESAAAAVTDRIVTHRLPETDDPARRAALVAKRGERSWHAGRDVAAAGDFAALADLVEPWAEVDPLSHSWNLAAARSNLAAGRRSAGQLAEALAAARSAAQTRRRMAERKPSVFLPSYALSCYQLALLEIEDGHAGSAWQTLAELDRFCAGVVDAFAGRQSAKLAQLLAPAATRDVGAPGAGAAADSFAALCRSTAQDIVDYEQSIAALFPRQGESVEQAGRRAARSVPVDFLADIGAALYAEHRLWTVVDEVETAWVACRGAVEFFRLVARAAPGEHLMSLSQTLDGTMRVAAVLGRAEDACTYGAEAVDGYQAAADLDPTTYEPQLATLLIDVTERFLAAGRREGAFSYSERAVAVLRRCADRESAALPVLAGAEGQHGLLASVLGQHDLALRHTARSVELYRELLPGGGEEHEAGLGLALCRYGLVRIAADRDRLVAAEAIMEALEWYGELERRGETPDEEFSTLVNRLMRSAAGSD
ncbi:hypothetical protein ABGB07_41485 [Micromonosporaceae bacterium B7E4]